MGISHYFQDYNYYWCPRCGQYHRKDECSPVSYWGSTVTYNLSAWTEIYYKQMEIMVNNNTNRILCKAKWNAEERVVLTVVEYNHDATGGYDRDAACFDTLEQAKQYAEGLFAAAIDEWLEKEIK